MLTFFWLGFLIPVTIPQTSDYIPYDPKGNLNHAENAHSCEQTQSATLKDYSFNKNT